jgi:fructokinase
VAHVGTLALVLEPLATATEMFIHAMPAETLLFVDPNCRPSIIANRDAYSLRLMRVLQRADVIKVSSEDLAYLFPEEQAQTAAQMLHRQTDALILFTDGASAVWLFGRDFTSQVPVPKIDVVDTVGAGDVCGAAWLAWWLIHHLGRCELADEKLVAAAAVYAIGAASWTCQHSGASVPTLVDAPIL